MKSSAKSSKKQGTHSLSLIEDAYRGMSFDRIGPSLVISRKENGEPLSLFIHDEWYLPQLNFSSTDRHAFDFSVGDPTHKHYTGNKHFKKSIFIACLYPAHIKTGQPRRISSMYSILCCLNHVTSYAEKTNVPAQALFRSIDMITGLIEEIPKSYLMDLKIIARTISSNDLSIHDITTSTHVSSLIKKAERALRDKQQKTQTPIIPSRILAHTYNQCTKHVKSFIHHSDKISAILAQACADETYARGSSPHKNFQNTLKAHELTELAKQYNWDKINNIPAFLRTVQYCAKNLIQLFTLMRDHEVLNLESGCGQPIKGWDGRAMYLMSTTTKMKGTAQELKWITTKLVLKPIEALEKIRAIILPHVKTTQERNWLFFSPTHMGLGGSKPNEKSLLKLFLSDRLTPIHITEKDIQELESIQPHHNWRADKNFKIGAPWKLNSHQFRRSIAVFAGQSGLITIQSLKRLLQHLTEGMSMYYQKGCSANNYNFGLANPELTKDIREAKSIADNALYIREIMQSQETLGGFHGIRVKQQQAEKVWIFENEDEFHRRVEQGLQAFESSPFGGCVSTTPCDKRAMADVTTCAGCENCCVVPSKINSVIEELTWDLSQLTPGTIEYRAEQQNLQDYELLRDRTIGRA
ncbi:hypothetical protein [Pseudomonas sp. KCJK8806]|uniref:hypothetical protein n=1 Tax=Pseudomonas sp. KCJK8806 TaxID=3344559 RepID=UPI00390586E5